MSTHQVIYTSCMRGIKGNSDGQQVFSHDAKFTALANDEIRSLFAYMPPALEPGVIMTEEIAATLPHSFKYRRLKDGTCTLTLSTYLGRDYMGSAGRFGNQLSHVITADENDMFCYPCEFYGSEILRSHMEYEEVNNPNPPEYLPTPVLEKGNSVNIDSVIEFLSVGNRLDIYKNMLYGMLVFEKERKRVVICDEPENIIFWIAALEYAIPLRVALDINFATYEFDPSLSVSQICGVVKSGTKYTKESQRLHFVFDMYQQQYTEFKISTEYYDFIEMGFSLSYESIRDFHAFIEHGYNYKKVDEEMYGAYALYSLLSDGIKEMRRDRLQSALQFANKYAKQNEKIRIIKIFLSQIVDFLYVDKDVFLDIIEYILFMKNKMDKKEYSNMKGVIITRVLQEFTNTSEESIFLEFYNNIEGICKLSGFILSVEFMSDNHRMELLAAMQGQSSTWKIAFVIRVIAGYIKEKEISVKEIVLEKELGNLVYGIISTVYSQSAESGCYLIKSFLNEFNGDDIYFTYMTLNIEKMVEKLRINGQEKAFLWDYFGEHIVNRANEHISKVYEILKQNCRYEQAFILFELELQKALDIVMSKKVFDEHYRNIVETSVIYKNEYEQEILKAYYVKLKNFGTDKVEKEMMELFDLLYRENKKSDFSDELINNLVEKIPFQKLDRRSAEFIQNAFQYTYNYNKQPLGAKLFLLLIGLVFEKIYQNKMPKSKIKQLQELAENQKANLEKLSEKNAEEYFAWILPIVCEICQKKEEMVAFWSLFEMMTKVENQFFEECTKLYLKVCKENKNYDVFVEYFGFLFEYCDIKTQENIGKNLRKLNKNKWEEIEKSILQVYKKDKKAMECWKRMKASAEEGKISLNDIKLNIVDLFKQIKKEN